ncbi:MAG TPA: hypothetical protein VEJ41_02120 [Candidatus Acidoferrales bacterium]|nr:hypothetical protein [Candidatus Acidoferrales bacterium]
MKASIKFKGGEFRFRPHFSNIEFDVTGMEGRATGRLTTNDCLALGKHLMDIYYARTMRQHEGAGEQREPAGES